MPSINTVVEVKTTRPGFTNGVISKQGISSTWTNSPRNAKGHLVLRANAHSYLKWAARRNIYDYVVTDTFMGNVSVYEGYVLGEQIRYPNEIFSIGQPGAKTYNECRNEAAWRFYKRLAADGPNLAQIVAERQQTINLITKRVMSLVNAYRSLRNGRNPFDGFKPSDPKQSANLWLEYSYGWRPLVSDVHALLDLDKLKAPHGKIVGRHSMAFPPYDIKRRTLVQNPGLSYDYHNKRWGMVHVSTGANITCTDPSLAFLNGVGLVNPAVLAWELLPYSFVVDWFLPIGDWLQMQSATVGFSLTNTFTMVSADWGESTTHKMIYTKSLNRVVTGSPGGINVNYYKFKQRSLSILGVPPPKLRLPLDPSKALSAIGLLIQTFKH